MRSDDVATIKSTAERVGWETVAELMLDDMSTPAIRKLAGKLHQMFETPEDNAITALKQMMSESDAAALVERVKASGKEYRNGNDLFVLALEMRTR